jgi:hypothetical protein
VNATRPRPTVVYRILVWLYPPRFRREYRDDLFQAFHDELRDRGTARGWQHILGDLFISLPTQHLEVAMARSSFGTLTQLIIVGAAVLALVAFGGVFALAALLVIAAATFVFWRGRIPYREAVRDSSASWWKFLIAGAALFATLIIATNYGPDFDWFPWHLLVLLVLIGWALLGLGAILGLVTLSRHVRHRIARAS